jgi:hypothetical protein
VNFIHLDRAGDTIVFSLAGNEGKKKRSEQEKGPGLQDGGSLTMCGEKSKRFDLMAGYSGTPLVQKLGIRPNERIIALNAPPDYARLLEGFAGRRRYHRAGKRGGGFYPFVYEEPCGAGAEINQFAIEISRHRHPLGFVAEEVFRRGDGCDGRRDSHRSASARIRGRQSLCGRRDVVGFEIDDPADEPEIGLTS